MFPSKNLELYFWNDLVGDMDCEAFDLNLFGDLADVCKIEILIMDYPLGDEVALVTYYGDHSLPAAYTPIYIVDQDDETIFTQVVYSPNPDYAGIELLLNDSPKEAARYVLYSKDKGINRINTFVNRENPFDIQDWR